MDKKAAAKNTTTTKSNNDDLRQLKFRYVKMVRETHKHVIYCVSWSSDIFTETYEQVQQQGTKEEATAELAANVQKDEATPQSQSTTTTTTTEPTTSTRFYRCLASVAGPCATIYEVEIPDPDITASTANASTGKSGDFQLRQAYVDPDKNEQFFTCAFGGRTAQLTKEERASAIGKKRTLDDLTKPPTSDQSNNPQEDEMITTDDPILSNNTDSRQGSQLLCVAGTNRSIKVIDPVRLKLIMTLQGHGNDIHDLNVSPVDEWLLLSASSDTSCRLWNLKNGTSIAIFSGHEGHLDGVVSATWHCFGTKFISGGIDTRVKIWDIAEGEGGRIAKARRASDAVKLKKNENDTYEPETYFKPVQCQFPIFSTNKVHINTVDCVEFIGDIVLSKSIDEIVMWLPVYPVTTEKLAETPSQVQPLRTFKIRKVDIWYFRFGTDPTGENLAVGNLDGDVLLWNVGQKKDAPYAALNLTQKWKTMIRKTVFSPDGKILLCCCDDGGIWKWDVC